MAEDLKNQNNQADGVDEQADENKFIDWDAAEESLDTFLERMKPSTVTSAEAAWLSVRNPNYVEPIALTNSNFNAQEEYSTVLDALTEKKKSDSFISKDDREMSLQEILDIAVRERNTVRV